MPTRAVHAECCRRNGGLVPTAMGRPFHDHHLRELKPWLLGTKSGGFSTNSRGRQVPEGRRMLGRLKLHYVAMTRPTHLLCLAMRNDAFGHEELDVMTSRGWTIIDCCDPDQQGAAITP